MEQLHQQLSKGFSNKSLKLNRWLVILDVLEKYGVESVLEFGSGLSTLLFEKLGVSVISLETNPEYLRWVRSRSRGDAKFVLWDNENYPLSIQPFDMALVDGDVPRRSQAQTAQKCSSIVCMDDWGRGLVQKGWSTQGCGDLFTDWRRVDNCSTILAVFEDESKRNNK